MKIFQICFLVVLFASSAQGQPIELNTTDSIFISVYSGTKEGEVEIGIKDEYVYVHGDVLDQTAMDKFWDGDTSIHYSDLYEEREIILQNDSLSSYIRAKVGKYLFKDHWNRVMPAGKYVETAAYYLKIQIWKIQIESQYALHIERNYYCVLSNMEYVWSEDFSRFSNDLIELHKRLE